MSPHIAIFKPSILFFLVIIVKASNKAWVGCSLLPSPAFKTAQLTFWESKLQAPESWCLITIISGCIAFNVIAVSINVSPFFIAELLIFMDMTSAPSLLPANSNELWVLVEGSKNKFIWVFPLNVSIFLFLLWLTFINLCASSRIKFTSLIDKSWIPSKCFWEILIALFVGIAIKTNSIAINPYNSKY